MGHFGLLELFVLTADGAVQAAEELFNASLHRFFVLFELFVFTTSEAGFCFKALDFGLQGVIFFFEALDLSIQLVVFLAERFEYSRQAVDVMLKTFKIFVYIHWGGCTPNWGWN